jgi:hypothetical protein
MLNNQQAMVIDPILTTFVRGYSNNDYVGSVLFPEVNVMTSGGQVIQFGKEHFVIYDTQRAPGGATRRVEFGYLGDPYATENHALEALVPDETGRDAALVPGIDLAREAVALAYDAMKLKLEYQQAKVATTAANYPASNVVALAGTTQWDSTTSTPVENIVIGREAIRASTGKYPTSLILPPGGIMKLDQNASIRDRLKYTSSDTLTAAMLARLFQVDEVVEGNAVYTAQATGQIMDVWGNNAVLAYVPKNFRSVRAPSYGYTYQLTGNPNVKMPYRDNNRDSWVYGVKHERVPVIAGAGAGYLLQNVFGS